MLDIIQGIVSPLIRMIGGTMAKIAEPLLLAQIVYISTVIVPMIILAIIYVIFLWSTTSNVTSFMTSGTFNESGNLNISPTSPMMILFYCGIVLALIMFIIFIANGIFWQGFNHNSEITGRQRYVWIFYFALSLIFIPIFFLILNFFMQVIGKLFVNVSLMHWHGANISSTTSTNILGSISGYIAQINALNLNQIQGFDQAKFDELYKNIKDTTLINHYQNLKSLYNVWIESWNTGMVNGFLKDYLNNLNNPENLKTIFSGYNEFLLSLNKLSQNINSSLITIKPQISATDYTSLEALLGNQFTNSDASKNVINILNSLQTTTNMYAHGTFSQDTGQLLNTNNIVFECFYLLTGNKVSSISEMLGNWPIPLNNLFLTARAILIGAFTSGILIKVFLNWTLIGITRLVQVGWLTIWGLVAFARGVNDVGATARVWFRESLTAMSGIVVAVIGFQVFQIIIWSIINGQGVNAWYNSLDQSIIGGSTFLNNLNLKNIFLLIAIMIFALVIDISIKNVIERIRDGNVSYLNMAQSVLNGRGSVSSAQQKVSNVVNLGYKNAKKGFSGGGNGENKPFGKFKDGVGNWATKKFNGLNDAQKTGFKGNLFKALGGMKRKSGK